MARGNHGERWRKIPGFSGYEVSTLGRVRSYKGVNQNAPRRKKPLILNRRIGDGGYLRVTLQDDAGVKRVVPVHLAVARAFLGPAKGRLVRHLDDDPLNPELSNLKYGTIAENLADKHRHGNVLSGEDNAASQLLEEEVIQIYALRGMESQANLAKRFGVSRQAVSDIQRGITWADITSAR